MTNEDKIRSLQSLINEFVMEQQELILMIENWNNHDDPCSDPGLQFEQEELVNNVYNKIKDFAKEL